MLETCANCGKQFFVSGAQWGYAYDGMRTCSYHCMREMRMADLNGFQVYDMKKHLYAKKTSEIANISREMEKKMEIDKETAEKIEQMRAEGKGYKEISEATGVQVGVISGYCVGHKLKTPKKPETLEAVPVEPVMEERIDTVRVVNILCDIAEQLIAILREGAQ